MNKRQRKKEWKKQLAGGVVTEDALTDYFRKGFKRLFDRNDKAIQAAFMDSMLFGDGRVKVSVDGGIQHVPYNPFDEEQARREAK